jgi:predicted DCC family thiol-disulfide oxidoreductase YuxK
MARVTVWFDGDCPLCLQEIALMQRLDRRGAVAFIDVARGEASCPIDRRELLARFHADENGHLLSGAAAFAAMWRAIPILRPFGLLARNPHVLGGLERAYLAFLKIRPTLQLWARRREADRVRAV